MVSLRDTAHPSVWAIGWPERPGRVVTTKVKAVRHPPPTPHTDAYYRYRRTTREYTPARV